MNPTVISKYLNDFFGISVSLEDAEAAYKDMMTYHDLEFETLRGKYKLSNKGDCYILLAVHNTQMHNGAWERYVEYLKSEYSIVLVQSVVNKRLLDWFLRNDFVRTKRHNDWVIWRSER